MTPSPAATELLLLTALPEQETALAALIAEQAPDVRCWPGSTRPGKDVLASIDVVLGWRFPPGLAAQMPKLRWVCSMAAGVEKLLVPELPPQVPISRVVDPEQALGMAQFAALMVLRHLRGLPRYEQQQRERRWKRHPMPLARERVLVLGMGEVGREVARQLSSLGLEVSGWRRNGVALTSALRDARVVINCLPLTPATTGLLNGEAFAAMPRGGYLVNLARGGHVVEPDLIAAVRAGHLAGAALDVQAQEPLPVDDPLWDVPGITITPHVASQPAHTTVVEQFIAGLRCLQRGEALPNRVDRSRGY